MDLGLDGRLVLVTGSTRGIGRASARLFLEEGAEVVVHGSSSETVDPAVEELSPHGTVHGVAADLTSADEVETLCREVEALGPLDVLVNNAGIFEQTPFPEIGDDEWRRHLEVNLMGPVRLSRHFLPRMLERDRGTILMVASEAGVKPVPYMLQYSTTKTALVGLGRGLAELTKGTDVRVNTILPGPTLTGNVKRLMEDVAEEEGVEVETLVDGYFEAEEPTSLLQRFERPEEVARVIVFLCSPAARVINGSAQRAEGGIIRSVL